MSHPVVTAAQVGRILQSARKTRHLSQADLGVRVGLSQKRISALELQPSAISVDQLMAICATLGLELVIQEKPGSPAGPTPERPNAKTEW